MKWAVGLAAALILAGGALVGLAQVGAGAGGGRGAAGGGAGRGAGGGAAGAAAVALNRAFYTTELETLEAQLTLTEEEKARLQDKIATMNKELDAFLQNAQPQVAAARRGARAGLAGQGAATRGGVAGALAGNPTVLKLQDDLQLLANEHQVLINQALTPEQRITWETYKLTRVLDPRLQSLGLTDDQKDQVKALVDETAKALAALTDGKTVQELQGKLLRKLVADVLTDAQAGKFMEGPLAVQGAAAGRGAGAGTGAGTGAGVGGGAGGAGGGAGN